ncbi:Methyltransferase domain-containing protein [Sanguibacter gelidistatuariae]|uniref:Methyltransferase domain-containing protein n=1 Tax=Sanguibacter gelidistatuariae TaxID=1814289 RepID=A0A1G6WEU9_9MICO|nr:class I SAM-dependent methyltransferase [Sanguibacter gelidistatuariae]SDD64382.1 Methyltransferase domain-containing protein [Sanguibacter gelidistatuariae]
MTSNLAGDGPAPTTAAAIAPPHARQGVDPASRTDRAQSFEQGAQVYAQVRPEYPPEAVDWLLPAGAGPGTHVLDLAAGTGKLTRSLVARGLQVTAVEPSQAMRAELERALPQATALPGTAESIPLETASVDTVVVGQAWHWFSPEPAAAEIARVLRPGGRLGIVWNVRDNSTDWVRAFTEIIHRGDTLAPSYQPPTLDLPDGALFGPPEHTTFRWHAAMTPAGLRALAASRSYLLTLDAASRDALLNAVDHLTSTHPDLRGKDLIDLPYDAQCWRADRLPSPLTSGPGRG